VLDDNENSFSERTDLWPQSLLIYKDSEVVMSAFSAMVSYLKSVIFVLTLVALRHYYQSKEYPCL
jgi:hypothetical protein